LPICRSPSISRARPRRSSSKARPNMSATPRTRSPPRPWRPPRRNIRSITPPLTPLLVRCWRSAPRPRSRGPWKAFREAPPAGASRALAQGDLALEDPEGRATGRRQRLLDIALGPAGSLLQQGLEEPDVERVGLDDDGQARADPRTRDLHAEREDRALSRLETRVEDLARQIQGALAAHDPFLPASGDRQPGLVHQFAAQDDPRRDIGRKRVADARAGHPQRDDRDVAGAIPGGARLRGDREPGAHHVGVVNAAPPVPPLRHVAVLALHALAGEPARLPFAVGVLQELAVQREPVGRELVTAGAEFRLQERRRAGDAVVGQGLARGRARQRAVAARRAEALVAAHVA